MSAYWVNKLNESESRLHKEGVLKMALGLANIGDDCAIRLLTLLHDCYNPFVTYGLRTAPTTVGITGAENPWSEFQSLLSSLAARELTGHAARDAVIEIAERFDSDEWNTFCRQILLKDIRAGISEKTVNKVCKGTQYEIPVFGCQLATDCTGRPEMKGVRRLEPKMDGVRSLFVVEFVSGNPLVTCYSRNGKVFENFSHICDQLVMNADRLSRKCTVFGHSMANGFVLDGEVVGKSFNALMKQARRKTDVAADDSVLQVFDVIPLTDFRTGHWNAPLKKRMKTLEAMMPIIHDMDSVVLSPHIDVDLDTAAGRDQYHRYCNDMVLAGFEGVMIKNPESPYEARRSTSWLKYKPTISVDLTVIALEEGTGKNLGRLGALVCEGIDAGRKITVNCGSGFTDEQRQEIWDNRDITTGQMVEVLADAVSQNQDGTYSLRFPRFIKFRFDKE